MNSSVARRTRLLRLRAVEHRVATVRSAAARAAHADVVGVADRLAQLRADLVVPLGTNRGHNLQSFVYMSDRLERAQGGLAVSLVEAQQTLALRETERVAALIAEDRTAQVHAQACRREAIADDLRAATALPALLKRETRI